MKKSAEKSYIFTTLLVDYLVKQGVAFREAHEIIGRLIGYCIENGTMLIDLNNAELKGFSQLLDQSIINAIFVRF
jgi:argininosuccinate lyase